MDRVYFLCEKGGKTESIITNHINNNRLVAKSWFDFAKKHGGTGSVYAGSRALAFQFDDEPPSNWYKTKDMPIGYFKPKKGEDLKAFKSLSKKLGLIDLSKSISIREVCYGHTIYWASYKKYGDKIILSLVEGMSVPSDVEELKMSEYFKIKENFEEKSNGDVKC